MAPKRQPSEFEKRLKKTEQRAKRKLYRLQHDKGILTGGINPLRDTSAMSTQAKVAYERKLEAFISRENRYVAGYEGTPIRYATVKEIRAVEKKLNDKRAKMFSGVADKTLLVPGTDMTAADYRQATRTYDVGSGSFKPNPKSPLFFTEEHHRDISMLKGESAAKAYIKALKHAGTKDYVDYKNKILKENMIKVMRDINEPELERRIRKLTIGQIYELITLTPFIESVFMNSGRDGVSVVQGIVEHLHDMLDAVGAK